MPRNRGSTIDVERGQVCDRDGCWHPLGRLVVADGGLYYARPTPTYEQFSYHERWLLLHRGWVINRFATRPHVPDPLDWYIETDFISLVGATWQVRDGYLDVEVYEGLRYEVRDADELGEGMLQGEISMAEAAIALDALNRLCAALRRYGFSGSSLLEEYAPGLPG